MPNSSPRRQGQPSPPPGKSCPLCGGRKGFAYYLRLEIRGKWSVPTTITPESLSSLTKPKSVTCLNCQGRIALNYAEATGGKTPHR